LVEDATKCTGARALRTRHRGRARTDVTTVAGKCRLKNDYLGLPDDDPLLLEPVLPLAPLVPLVLAPLAPLLSEPDAPLSGLAGAA
jgi:hypothetical protein